MSDRSFLDSRHASVRSNKMRHQWHGNPIQQPAAQYVSGKKALSKYSAKQVPVKEDVRLALILAVKSGVLDNIKSLIKRGVSMDAQDDAGHTALHYAVARGDKEILQLLLSGVSINIQDNQGKTALHYAAARGDKEIVQLLLSDNADLTIVDKQKQTALDVAKNTAVREFLKHTAICDANDIYVMEW